MAASQAVSSVKGNGCVQCQAHSEAPAGGWLQQGLLINFQRRSVRLLIIGEIQLWD